MAADLPINLPRLDSLNDLVSPRILVSPRRRKRSLSMAGRHKRTKTMPVSILRMALKKESAVKSKFSFEATSGICVNPRKDSDCGQPPHEISGEAEAIVSPAEKVLSDCDFQENLQPVSSVELKEYIVDISYQGSLQKKSEKVREALELFANGVRSDVLQPEPASLESFLKHYQKLDNLSRRLESVLIQAESKRGEFESKRREAELKERETELKEREAESLYKALEASREQVKLKRSEYDNSLLKLKEIKSMKTACLKADLEWKKAISDWKKARSVWKKASSVWKKASSVWREAHSASTKAGSEYNEVLSERWERSELIKSIRKDRQEESALDASISTSLLKLGQSAVAQVDELIELIQRLKDEGNFQDDDAAEQLNMLSELRRGLARKIGNKNPRELLAVLFRCWAELKSFDTQLNQGLNEFEKAFGETITKKRKKLQRDLSLKNNEVPSSVDQNILKEREKDIQFLSDFVLHHKFYKHSLKAYQKIAESETLLNLAALKKEIILDGKLLNRKARELMSDPSNFIQEIESAYQEVFFEKLEKLEKPEEAEEPEDESQSVPLIESPAARKLKRKKNLSSRVDDACGTINNRRLLWFVRLPRVFERVDLTFLGKLIADNASGKYFLATSTVPIFGVVVATLNCIFYGLRWLVFSCISLKNRWKAIKEEDPELSYLGMSQELIKSSFISKKRGDKISSQVDLVNRREEQLRGYKKRNDLAWFSTNALCGFFANDFHIKENLDLGGGVTSTIPLGPLLIMLLYLFDCWNARKRLKNLEEDFKPFEQEQSENIKALETERDELKDAMEEPALLASEKEQKKLDLSNVNARLKLKKEAWNNTHIKHLQEKIESKVGYQVAKSLFVLTVGYYLTASFFTFTALSVGAMTLGAGSLVFAALVFLTHLSSMYMKSSIEKYVDLTIKGEIGQLSKKSFLLLQAMGVTDAKDIRDYVKQTRTSQKSTGLLSRCTLGFLERKATKLEKSAADDPGNENEAGKSKSDLTLLKELVRKKEAATSNDDAQQASAVDTPDGYQPSLAC